MAQFNKDYARGKESELESLPDLKNIFTSDLILDNYKFAHFDYQSDIHAVELKTRDNVKYVDGQFECTTRKGDILLLSSLYFDSIKLEHRLKEKKKGCKKIYWIVWKCGGEYFGWLDNNHNNEYEIEPQFRDVGHGYKQNRDVVKVYTKYIHKLS